MRRRTLALIAGLVAIALGTIAVFVPGVIPLGVDRPLVSIIGLLALVQAIRVIQRRRDVELREASTPDPERSTTTPQPGDDFRSVLGQFLGRRGKEIHLDRITQGLHAAAVTVLTRFEGLDDETAKERVASGTWTDDDYAAAFLAEEDVAEFGLRERLRNALAGESRSQRRIRHTVRAIARIASRRRGTRSGDGDTIVHSNSDRDADGPHYTPPGAAETADGETENEGESHEESESVRAEDSDRPVSTKDWITFGKDTDQVLSKAPHSTRRWRGASVVALVGIGIGVLVQQPAALLAGVVGIGYAAFARSQLLSPGPVSIERTVSDERPEPGEEVTVTVTVTNGGDRVRPDLRIVDGVPPGLTVESGSPRHGTALGPGKSDSFSYTLRARRGDHSFGPTLVIGRDLPGSTEEQRHCQSETSLLCRPSLAVAKEPVALRGQAMEFGGQQRTERTGQGIEFSATREYRPGDPMGRIDWNRRARTRELTTIEYHEERAASVVLLVDARAAAYVSPGSDGDHAVDRTVEAAGHLFPTLLAAGHRVGIAAAGAKSCWLPPGTGVDHRERARELLALDSALSPAPKSTREEAWRWQRTLHNRLDHGTQVLFLTPLADEEAGRIARQLDERGFPVTVITPDATGERSPSHRLARVARQLQVTSLRDAGIPVLEWAWSEPLDRALARHNERRRP